MDELTRLKQENEELKREIEKLKIFHENRKKGMSSKSKSGEIVSRAPFGYKIVDKKLVPGENSNKIHEIFDEFLNSESSLTQIAKKHELSVPGLKKILTNFTYIGMVKFDGLTHQGSHQPLVSPTLFNHVQNKIEKLGLK